MTKASQLSDLARLAGMQADRSAARLAKVQGLIDDLERQAEALRGAAPAAPESVAEAVMRDKWQRWREQQLAMFNHQIARLQVVAQPQREVHARDTARKAVLEKLRARHGRR